MNVHFDNRIRILSLGQSIREIRRKQDRSIEEVARQVGITKSHLSQIERGKVNPSVNKLWSLADALGTAVADLLNSVSEKKRTCLSSVKAKFISDGVKCFSLHPPSRKDFEFTYVEYVTGSSGGKQLGKHGGIEYLLVVDGTIKFTLGEREYVLHKDHSIKFWGNIPHGAINIGKKKARTIYMIFPEKSVTEE